MTCTELKAIYVQWRRDQLHDAMANAAHVNPPDNNQCGFVCWEAVPPVGVAWWRHKHTLIDAIYTALAFTHTDISDEWALVGPSLMPLIRTAFRFKELVPVMQEAGLILFGTIKNIRVFYNPEMIDPNYGSDIRVNFICGNGKLYTWCVANNLPNVISSKLPHSAWLW